MARRRRAPLVLRVCIGVFLLLFSAVVADATKDPSTSTEKAFDPDASDVTISPSDKTIVNKLPSNGDTEVASSRDANETTDTIGKQITETSRDAPSGAVETEDAEKVPIPIDDSFNPPGIGSRERVDKLSTADSTNGGSKLDGILYGTSGKSSSTKTLSEDSYRLSGTNGLTTAAARPFSEESKHEERKAETVRVQSSRVTVKLSSNKAAQPLADGSELKEEVREAAKAESVTSHGEINGGPGLKLETINAEGDSSEQKVRFLGGFQERRKKSESPGKNSEVPDLKEADGNERNDGVISLIGDTNVNYVRRYETSTERDVETPLGDQSRPFEDAPGLVTHVSPSVAPKEEVEVVSNVTHPAVQRFVEPRSQIVGPKDAGRLNEVSEKSSTESHQDPNLNSTEAVAVAGNDRREPEQLPSATSTTPQGPSSPVPRGRTIGFSGINEFPGMDIKPTIASKLDTSFAKKNTTDKPYPYVKSSTKDQLPNAGNEVDRATEEPSTLENTIGKGQTEEKFIVTEASDVLENSIQQFKPSYPEEVGNESTVSSTEVRPSVPMTTASLARLDDASPTNQSSVDKSGAANGIVRPEEKSGNEGNDVPRWSEGHGSITGKGSIDVTGNGITEVSLKPESDKHLQEIADRTTPAPLTTESFVPRTDVQTSPEGSLLIRSTLNVSEASTEYPLVNGDPADRDKVSPQMSIADATTARSTESATVLPTSIEETSIGNATEVPRVADINGNNEIPSGGGGTSSPDDTPLATTTGIEYEFVGLTESTVSIGRNGTEANDSREVQNGGFTVLPTVRDPQPTNGSGEVTAPANEPTTENASTVTATESVEVTSVEDRVSSVPATDPTIVPTVQNKDDSTQASVIDGQIGRNATKEEDGPNTTGIATDPSTTTIDGDVGTTTARVEQTVPSDSKDWYSTMNVTGPPAEFTSITSVNATTDDERAATYDPSATSSLRPRIPVSSGTDGPAASDAPTLKTDDPRPTTPEQEITSLVRIDMEGNRHDVCRKVDKLKLSLVEIFRSGMNKSVSDRQIKFHQNPCQESASSAPTASDIPLMSMLVYVVDENGRFDAAMTKILPRLYEDVRERVTFPVTIHRFLLVQETIPDSGNAIAVVVVSSVAFICLILLAGLLFIMRKRQTRFNYGERCRPVSLDAYSLDSVSAYNSVRRKGVARSSKRSYGNPTFEDSSAIPSHPLNFAGLSTFCNDVNAINDEFSGIPQVSAKIDELPSGAEVKNRYANVIPLPETRVPLQKINNDPLTEYINASYVRGPKNATRYYIACQAPMEPTVTDFWRMIWEQQCKVIIMLTDLVENGVEKCTEYIPPSEVTDCHRLYGDYQVTLKKRETKEKYAITTLHLKNLENNTFREVYHIWYLWPVNGAQSDGVGLIAVLLEARALQRGGPGPIVVHCSPGTGRSGTLIALDLGIRQYEITRTVDVPRVVYTIRRDRAGAVQTKEQYAFIYKALNLYATKLAGGVLEST